MTFKTVTVVSVLFLIPLNAFGCSIPKNGYGWGFAELVDKSDSIVLATLASQDEHVFSVENVLRVIEVIKGPPVSTVLFSGQPKGTHDGFDYFGHKAPWFWLTWSGRSEFPCCICGPDFTFRDGETYLLFPNSFGALKSAEIIKGTHDLWYRYVKERVDGR